MYAKRAGFSNHTEKGPRNTTLASTGTFSMHLEGNCAILVLRGTKFTVSSRPNRERTTTTTLCFSGTSDVSITIQEVRSRKELRQFIAFPHRLYRGNPQWVPPLRWDEHQTLRREKNPAFGWCRAKYWLAYDGREIVGRIAGIINTEYIRIWKKRTARFGWIDFVDSPDVARALFQTVEQWARAEGMDAIHGPLGFTDMDREGMLIEGFDELGTMATTYNHPYYPVHTRNNGYEKEFDWVEFEIRIPDTIPDKAVRVARYAVERHKLHMLEARKAKDFLPYAQQIFAMINSTYADFAGFVPLSPQQIAMYIKQYIPNVHPHYVKVILDQNNSVAGFVIGMPSLSRALQKADGRIFPFGFMHILWALHHPRTIDLYLGAVRTDLQGKGADALLITDLARTCIADGIISAESNVELEDNKLVQGHWKLFERRQHKRRRCFTKSLA